MLSMSEVQDAVSGLQQEIIESCTEVKADAIGLDQRCGVIYVARNREFVATTNIGSLDYYGGFEYIDKEHTVLIGDMKVYSAESDRVRSALDYLEVVEDDSNEASAPVDR